MNTTQFIFGVSLLLAVVIVSSESFAVSRHRVRRDVIVPKEFQNINIDNYLKNKRAVKFQVKCILDNGPCDRIGKFIKNMIPEVLETQCKECDPKEREKVAKMFNHIQSNFPDDWEQAIHKYNGGLVKAADAAKLEEILGVKLNDNLVMSS